MNSQIRIWQILMVTVTDPFHQWFKVGRNAAEQISGAPRNCPRPFRGLQCH